MQLEKEEDWGWGGGGGCADDGEWRTEDLHFRVQCRKKCFKELMGLFY